MARVAELADITDEMLAMCVSWYENPQRPAAFDRCDQRVVEVALVLAQGEWRRMVLEPGGAILVLNRPVW